MRRSFNFSPSINRTQNFTLNDSSSTLHTPNSILQTTSYKLHHSLDPALLVVDVAEELVHVERLVKLLATRLREVAYVIVAAVDRLQFPLQ